MLEFLASYIIHLIQTTGYFGIFGLMTLESVLIPIPSEVTMPFSGFLVSEGILNFWLVVIVASVANLVGSLIAYYIGYFLEEAVLVNLIRKYGKFILVTPKDYEDAEHWFKKYGDKIVFISRLLPAVRTVISLPAGVFEMNIKKFIIYTFVGSFIWSIVLTYIGVKLGENWDVLGGYFHKFDIVIVIVFVVLVIAYLNHKLHFLGKKK
jgi:membrane protein DedA with SNARE-associated domain